MPFVLLFAESLAIVGTKSLAMTGATSGKTEMNTTILKTEGAGQGEKIGCCSGFSGWYERA